MGDGRYSDLTVFSFHPAKIITTGEGGLVTTNRLDLYEKLIRLRSHGITREPGLMTEATHGPWYYQQLELGLNYRITDIQAALGASQMARLQEFVDRRRALAARYDELIAPGLAPDPALAASRDGLELASLCGAAAPGGPGSKPPPGV